MKSYEEKLIAALNEMNEKKVHKASKPTRAPRVLMLLNRMFGWKIPPLSFMSFWQIALYFSAVLVPVTIVLDLFLSDKGDQMLTLQYWFWYAFHPMTTVIIIAIMLRHSSKRSGLSRWEDL